jgi:N-acetylglucosamine-6-sulfatase
MAKPPPTGARRSTTSTPAAVHDVAAHNGVRTDRHKLFYLPDTHEWQLFDLEKDPQEMKSVHDDPAYATVLKDMQKLRKDLRAHYKVPGSEPDA